jgi:hypothetical protein
LLINKCELICKKKIKVFNTPDECEGIQTNFSTFIEQTAMQINAAKQHPVEELLQPRQTNSGARQVREQHLSKLGDQFLNQIEPAQAREILFRQIAKRLSNLGSQTPEPQSHSITSLPQQLVNHGVTLQQQGQAASDVRQALQQGLLDGRKMLSDAQLPTASANSVNQFEQQLSQGVNHSPLAAQYSHDSFSRENSASIEIRTKEGDTVRINISAMQSQSQSSLAVAGRGAAAAIYENNQQQSRQLHIEVEGNLSADELKSITQLVGKMDKLADKFYGGQDQAALASISSLQMDDNIAGFDLSFRSAEQTQQSQAQAVGREPLQFISDFMRESDEIISKVKQFIDSDREQLRSKVADIMHNMIELKHPQDEFKAGFANLEHLLKTDAQNFI